MHVVVHPLLFIVISVVSFGCHYQVWCKILITKQRTDTLNYVSEVQLTNLITNQHFLSLEGRTSREVFVNQFIKFS